MLTKKIIFLVAIFLALSSAVLFAPEARAADTLTIISSVETITVCRQDTRTFTIKKYTDLVGGAAVNLSGGELTGPNTCTTNNIIGDPNFGKCSITPNSIVKGDITVSASKGDDTGYKTLNVVKSANNEGPNILTVNTCKNKCDDDIGTSGDGGADCADDDCPIDTPCDNDGGLCTAAKTCVTPSGTLDITNFSPLTATVSVSTAFTFTSSYAGVIFQITSSSGVGITTNCTDIDADKSCAINLTPSAAGTITVKAHKSPYTDSPPITIAVYEAGALVITTDAGSSLIAGELVTVNFTVKKADAGIQGVLVSVTGSIIPAGASCTTNSSGTCNTPFTPNGVGTNVTFTATKISEIKGTLIIPIVASGGGEFGLPTSSLKDIIGRAIAWLLGIATALAVLFIIIGGLFYVSAAGDDSKVETGKKMIMYAVIGLMIVGLSYSIIKAIDKMIGGT